MTPKPLTGEARRNEGCQRADAGRKANSLTLRLLILHLASSGREFTADDLPDYGDEQRANSIGAGFLALSKKGLIVFNGQCRRSTRPYRHAGLNRVWTAPDVSRCLAEAAKVRAELAKLNPVPKQGMLFPDPARNGGHSDGW